MLGIANKGHRSGCFMRTFTTVEGFVSKIVLHGVNQDCIYSSTLLLLKLIPCYHIPVADKTKKFLVASYLNKEACRSDIATAYEYAIRRKFLKDVAYPFLKPYL